MDDEAADGESNGKGHAFSEAAKEDFIKRNVLSCGPRAVKICKELVESVTKRILDTDYLFEYTAVQLSNLKKSDEVQVGADAVLNKKRPPWAVKASAKANPPAPLSSAFTSDAKPQEIKADESGEGGGDSTSSDK